MPSGLDADTGIAYGAAIRADATATFIALKPGLLTGDGVDYCGTVSVHSLGLDCESGGAARGHRLDWPVLADALPDVLRRSVRNVHKGTFGTLGIIGGAAGMTGAPLLAGRAALHAAPARSGSASRPPIIPAVDWAQPELMLRPAARVLGAGADALVCGPGLGTDDGAADLVARAIAEPVPARRSTPTHSTLHRAAARPRRQPSPHARGADARHAASGRGRTPAREVRRRRPGGSARGGAGARRRSSAPRWSLKGAGSVLAYPDGHWDINATGNPGARERGHRRCPRRIRGRLPRAEHRSDDGAAARRLLCTVPPPTHASRRGAGRSG